MWKNIKTSLAVATIATGLSLGTALAQDNTAPDNNAATGVNTPAPTAPAAPATDHIANNDNGVNNRANNGGWGWGWGWIGLAGLIGLFGLMPRDNASGPRELGPPRR
jgi:hypothetical protein